MAIIRREFSCKRDSFTIRGYEYMDEAFSDKKDKPIAICSHGFLGNQKDTRQYAEVFAKNGYLAYTYDFVGGGLHGKSDGLLAEDMTLFTEVDDLKSVIKKVKEVAVGKADVSRISLMGCSQGGVVTALVAAELQEKIEKIVLFYPALCIPDDAAKGQMMIFKFDPENIPDKIKGVGRLSINGDYPREVIGFDVIDRISEYKGPVYIIHGSADAVVGSDYSERAVEAYRSKRAGEYEGIEDVERNVELVVLEGAGHGYHGKANEVAKEILEKFINDKRAYLTVDVNITEPKIVKFGINNIIKLPFEGSAIGEYFNGRIMPGAADLQKRKLFKADYFEAKYRIEGSDYLKNKSSVEIRNVFENNAWSSNLKADARLSVLNNVEMELVLEKKKNGLIVRFFS